MDAPSQRLLRQAFDAMGMSARAYHKIIMLSRTIADLAGSENILLPHIAEALQFRSLDKKYWA
jgi:magnesium chelatase family protein